MIPSKRPRMECLDGGTSTLLAGDAVDSNNNRNDTCGSTYGDRKSDHYDSKHHCNTHHENDHHDDNHHQSYLHDSKHQDRDHQDSKRQGQGRVGVGCRRPRVCAVKYQLRPRSLKSRYLCDPDWSLQDSLDHKPRTPLSRYRRKTANARERCRMRQINNAFESLRGMLPWWVCRRRAATDMTKIATLRLASAYIRSLQDMLDGNAPQDTCAWVLSSIFGEEHEPQQPEVTLVDADGVPSKPQLQSQPQQQQQQQEQVAQDTDLFTLLCETGEATPLNDLDTFSAIPSDSHPDPVKLFINCDPDIPWQQQQQTLVI